MQVRKIQTKPLDTNTYIIDESIVIDPGRGIGNYIENEVDVLLTHAHFDHTAGLSELKIKNLYIHPKDVVMLTDPFVNLSRHMGEEITYEGEWKDITKYFKVFHTPGHTPGSVIILMENYLFTGDTLFFNSIGRTDFPLASQEDMEKSLKFLSELLPTFPGETILAPGHLEMSNLKRTLLINPYL
ncbi:MAG TPA: MBL fold metallo-hydrolase [Tepiditoga sp.]|jgi:glyoxylase-like metal-dependent hydrolase (beta-lactamase superfamily II)|nr:MBL fold metallo-hydrolase [Thermotogota bacterium]HOO75202.1 MBL fold metallo-hydrolase [Tepiditoga sp.]